MGNGPGGLQRRGGPPGTTSRTTTPGRARTAGARTAWLDLRRRPGACACACLVERARPDPQGAHVRPDRPEGNHGEDVKEYWWYLDAVPSHSWLRWRYHYPQAEFPYRIWSTENGRRDQAEPEYELLDTGVFDDDRYWVVDVAHAKADPHDLLMEIRRHQRRPGGIDAACAAAPMVPEHLVLGCRRGTAQVARRPAYRVAVAHPRFGELTWELDSGPGSTAPDLLFCDNDTQSEAALRVGQLPLVPEGRDQRPRRHRCFDGSPDGRGTKAAGRYRLLVAPGETQVVRVRLRPPSSTPAFGTGFDRCSPSAIRKPTSSTTR